MPTSWMRGALFSGDGVPSRVSANLEVVDQVWLQSEGFPDPAHRGFRQSGLVGHRRARPVCCVGRLPVQRRGHHLLDLLVADPPRRSRSRPIGQPVQSTHQEPLSPFAHGLLRYPSSAPTCLLVLPAAQPNTIRHRCDNARVFDAPCRSTSIWQPAYPRARSPQLLLHATMVTSPMRVANGQFQWLEVLGSRLLGGLHCFQVAMTDDVIGQNVFIRAGSTRNSGYSGSNHRSTCAQ